MHAEVADVCVHEHTGRLREEHLPAVADRGDPCALVHVEADIALLRQARLARVQPHPHPYRPVGKRALAGRCSGNGVRCTGEGDEERVALRVDLDALMLRQTRHGGAGDAPAAPPVLSHRVSAAAASSPRRP